MNFMRLPWTGSGSTLKKPLDPDKTQVEVDVVFTETLDAPVFGRGVAKIEKTVEILLDDDVAKIHRDRTNQAQFLFVPKAAGDISDPGLEHVGPAHLETRPATAPMDGIEIGGNGMAVLAEGANDDMNAPRPSREGF